MPFKRGGKLEVGDVVIYSDPRHNSHGSMAVVVAVDAEPAWPSSRGSVSVRWVLAWGAVTELTPDHYNITCFEKIGTITAV